MYNNYLLIFVIRTIMVLIVTQIQYKKGLSNLQNLLCLYTSKSQKLTIISKTKSHLVW